MSKNVGRQYEQMALDYLVQNGLQLVVQNFNSRFGEIDIIMRDVDAIVFIEVKYRSRGLSSAIESISWAKQQKMIKAANFFLLKIGKDVACRFDAVVLDAFNNIEWLKNIIMF